MLKTFIRSLALFAAMTGCGGDDEGGDEDDASVISPDGGTDAGPARLQSGSYSYSNVTSLGDGCETALTNAAKPIPLINTGTQISLGTRREATNDDPTFTPAGHALGSGGYSSPTTANLSVNAHLKFADGCEFDVQRTTAIVFTGNDMVAVDYTDKQSNHNAACGTDVPNPCTSHYTFTLTRVAE